MKCLCFTMYSHLAYGCSACTLQVRLHPDVLATFSVVIVRDKSIAVKIVDSKPKGPAPGKR